MKNGMFYLFLVALLLPLSFFFSYLGFAFTGPSSAPGVGSGAIGTDSSSNVSIGTSTPLSTTKLYLVAPNTLSTNYIIRAVQPNTNPLFIVQNDGKVAIATTTPAGSTSTLLVAGNIYATGEITGSTINGPTSGTVSAGNVSSGQFGQNTGGGNYSFPASLSIGTTTPSGALYVQGQSIQIGNGSSNLGAALKLLGSSGNKNWMVSNQMAGGTFEIIPSTANGGSTFTTPAFVIDNSGNVGIGTAVPSSGKVLDVRGDLQVGATASTGNIYFGVAENDRIASTDASGQGFDFYLDGTSHFKIQRTNGIIVPSLNVGIGTTTPATHLHIVGNSDQFRISASTGSSAVYQTIGNTGNTIYLGAESSTGGAIATGSSANAGVIAESGTNPIQFAPGNTVTMTLLNGGNVGIGTPSPTVNGGGLEISRAGQAGVRVSDTAASGKRAEFGADTAGGFIQTLDAGANLRFYTDAAAGPRVTIDSAGLVGVGLSPSYRFEVVSAGATTARFGTASTDTVIVGGGSGKLDVGTIDPVYTIGGVRYATYVAAMTGQKEETTGTVRCRVSDGECRSTIDFTSLEKGSDLWLFSKVTNVGDNFDKLAVLLSPGFEGRAWYSKDSAKRRLTITARPTDHSLQKGEISYRLTAPRFDAAQWSNYYIGGGDVSGFPIAD